jgi:rhodanese-related sulfurtransferase
MRLFFLASILMLFACQGPAQESNSKQEISKLSVTELKSELNKHDDFYLIDVRTPREFEAGAIKGAVNYNISDGTLEKKLADMDRNKPVFVYCAVGGRSARAAQLLSDKGFQTVFDLKGGYNAWSSSNK